MISKNQICGKIFNMTLIVLVFQAILISTSDARKGNQTLFDVSMFTDQKARQVGDLLTIIVVERASASKEANTQTSRSSNRNGSLGGFVGINTRGLGKGIRLNLHRFWFYKSVGDVECNGPCDRYRGIAQR